MYNVGKSARHKKKANTRTNNYLFLQPKNLEHVLVVNMASRAKSESSAQQTAFTTLKFRASVGDAIRACTMVGNDIFS
jgi:hypothetical protein